MGVLFEKSLDGVNLENARIELEERYGALVASLRANRLAMKRGNVIAYWEFGDALQQFEQSQKVSILLVDGLVAHLVRDVPFSETMILLCRRFREKIREVARVDPHQSFTNYHRAGFDPVRLAATVRRRGRPSQSSSPTE